MALHFNARGVRIELHHAVAEELFLIELNRRAAGAKESEERRQESKTNLHEKGL